MRKKTKAEMVELTEDVLVVDDIGPDWLIRGTKGEVVGKNEDTLTLVIGKKTYSDIPAVSTKELAA